MENVFTLCVYFFSFFFFRFSSYNCLGVDVALFCGVSAKIVYNFLNLSKWHFEWVAITMANNNNNNNNGKRWTMNTVNRVYAMCTMIINATARRIVFILRKEMSVVQFYCFFGIFVLCTQSVSPFMRARHAVKLYCYCRSPRNVFIASHFVYCVS